MIEFRLDPRSGVPTYLQLVHQVKQALRLGMLQTGDQLPTVKEVVAALAINPNTVLKAYRELDLEGLVEGRRGQGTFVAAQDAAAPPDRSALRYRRGGIGRPNLRERLRDSAGLMQIG
jgi:GntR family transcriptional regulator